MMTKEGIGQQKGRLKQEPGHAREQPLASSSSSTSHDDRYPEAKRIRVGSDDGFATPMDPDRIVKKRRPYVHSSKHHRQTGVLCLEGYGLC